MATRDANDGVTDIETGVKLNIIIIITRSSAFRIKQNGLQFMFPHNQSVRVGPARPIIHHLDLGRVNYPRMTTIHLVTVELKIYSECTHFSGMYMTLRRPPCSGSIWMHAKLLGPTERKYLYSENTQYNFQKHMYNVRIYFSYLFIVYFAIVHCSE